jgi:adenylate kinase
MEGFLSEAGTTLDGAVTLDVPVDEVTARMLARGRVDDTEEAIRRRLDLYESETAPLLAWFADRGLLEVVDGMGDEDVVFGRLSTVIDARLSLSDAS